MVLIGIDPYPFFLVTNWLKEFVTFASRQELPELLAVQLQLHMARWPAGFLEKARIAQGKIMCIAIKRPFTRL